MKAKFIGDPKNDFDGPKVLGLFGRQFPKDRFITIEGADAEKVLAKLSANGHFEVAEGEGESPVAVAPDPLDHDRSGKKGGSRKKADIVAELEALAEKHPGAVEFDPTLGAPKLAALLEELKFQLGEDD